MQEIKRLVGNKKIVLALILEIVLIGVYGIFCYSRYSAQEEILYTDEDMQLLMSDGNVSGGGGILIHHIQMSKR